MEILNNILLGIHAVSDIYILGMIVLGVAVGIIIGAIPGLTATMAVGLAIPITFGMQAMPGLALLISLYVGGLTGGLISAILLNIPGTPSSICTTFDGYPMGRKNPGKALGYAIMASFLGGGLSYIVLLTLAPLCADMAVRLGSFEFFSLVMCAMVMIADSTEGSFLKAAMAGFAGMLISTVGIAPIDGVTRFTFDMFELSNGFDMTAMLLGLFALPQILMDVRRPQSAPPDYPLAFRDVLPTWADLKDSAWNIFRSSAIGTWVGILPGAGAVTASIVAYNQAKNASSHPETFGTGDKDGIIASEAANNAVSGGAMVPLLTLGIPGSPVAALLLSGLIIKDLQPGPALFATNPGIVYGLFIAFIVANVAMLILMLGLLRPFAMLLKVRLCYLAPFILAMCVIGSFVINNRMLDVWVLIGFGLLGFLMTRTGFPLGPMVLGLILGPIAELHIREGLTSSQGSFAPLVERPVSLAFLVLAVLVFVWPRYSAYRRRKAQTARGAA